MSENPPLEGTYKIVNRTPAYIQALISWCAEHGLDANDIRPVITFNRDGTITLKQYLKRDGKRYIEVRAGESVCAQPFLPGMEDM
jgi:hypothetical protein